MKRILRSHRISSRAMRCSEYQQQRADNFHEPFPDSFLIS
jgi:hypothetical protein